MLHDRDLLMKYKSDYLVILHTCFEKIRALSPSGEKVRDLFFFNSENILLMCIVIYLIRAYNAVPLGEYINLVSLGLL